MKPFIANLINSITLIGMSLWGYIGSEKPSLTALIPAGFGVVLILCTSGVKAENKTIAHVAVSLTLIVLLALAMPLKGAIGREDTMAIVRVGLMMLTSVFAMVMFVRSFINARKARSAAAST